jgi:SAM-dependent methyltransferase
MQNLTDPDFLKSQQYRNSSNLNARAELHRRFGTGKIDWNQWVFDQLDLPETAHVLELGAGPGWLWQENINRIPDGWHITLSDISEGMVAEQRQRLAGASHQFNHRVIDAQDVPFEDESFDAVVANHMLYHVPDLNATLKEIRRVLKPGGNLYAATNGMDHLKEISDFIFQLTPNPPVREELEFHRRFRLEDAPELLGRFFERVETRKTGTPLAITEAQPLVDYICSGLTMETCSDDLQDKMRQHFQRLIDRDGSIHVTRSTGILVAEKE